MEIRLELEPIAQGDAAAENGRLRDWAAFFAGGQPALLAGHDWAIDLPAGPLADKGARELDEQFGKPGVAAHFTSSGDAGAPSPRQTGVRLPQARLLPRRLRGPRHPGHGGVVDDPVRPRPGHAPDERRARRRPRRLGLLQMHADLPGQPLAGIITTFDQELPWFAFPLVGALLPLVPIAFGLGGDDVLTREAIKEAQSAAADKDGTVVVRTGLNSFRVDVTKKVTTPLTRDWLVVEDVAGAGDRLVLRGRFTAPDLRTLPRLRGR
nr:hypothetical protein GCM10020093_100320 [Planobispora longispora]